MSEPFEFDVWQEGVIVASVSAADEETAFAEAMHYAMMYAQDGPPVQIAPAQPPGAEP
ncbi:hypothetical protein [Phenylobacterium sp.]|uniref:hypothetical protein n=1 Tax=Phenylobacterium sp. TaxID=1871053 RepID=UPI0035B1851E